jgi:hypothetical protein
VVDPHGGLWQTSTAVADDRANDSTAACPSYRSDVTVAKRKRASGSLAFVGRETRRFGSWRLR